MKLALSVMLFFYNYMQLLQLPQFCRDQTKQQGQRSCSMNQAEDTGTGHPLLTSRSIIRAAPLRLLPGVHARSIYQVFSLGSSLALDSASGKTYLGAGFALRCFQRLSRLDIATQLWPRQANWRTSGPAISVLSYWR